MSRPLPRRHLVPSDLPEIAAHISELLPDHRGRGCLALRSNVGRYVSVDEVAAGELVENGVRWELVEVEISEELRAPAPCDRAVGPVSSYRVATKWVR